jgi:hypothetical protein
MTADVGNSARHIREKAISRVRDEAAVRVHDEWAGRFKRLRNSGRFV